MQIVQCNSPFSLTKFFSSNSSSPSSSATTVATQDELQQSFVVSYLINSCGLSPKSAASVYRTYAHKLRFDSTEKPDSMLAFLRKHGFTDADITRMVTSDPMGLLYSERTLLPKLQFFYSKGFTKLNLPSFIVKSGIWRHSLHGHIIPLYRLLKDDLISDKELFVAMKHLSFPLRKRGFKNIRPNLAFLRGVGVPKEKMMSLLRRTPAVLLTDPEELRRIVNEVKALGFDVTKSLFILAMHALTSGYKTTRERCTQIYMERGFAQEDIMSAFMKWPQFLLLSEKKLRSTLDFLMDKVGCKVEAIVTYPNTLTFNLDDRIIPRCSVAHVLVQKGLFKKDWSLSTIVILSESDFLDRFVTKHRDIVPDLLMVYQRKVDPFADSNALLGNMEK